MHYQEGLAKLVALLPHLTEDQIGNLEQAIGLREIEVALKALPQGKTPRPDGNIYGFCKVHKNVICSVFKQFFKRRTN